MTDQELHRGILDNDRAALAYVYAEYYPRIARQVRTNGGGEEDALDVFQDSVLALYLNAQNGKYLPREDSRLATYLQGVSKNIWRARRRQNARLASAASVDAEDEASAALLDRMDDLEKGFATLNDKCRRLLRLFYYEKLSLKRIAELMTFTEKTAKNNKYRCMQTLRAKLTSD